MNTEVNKFCTRCGAVQPRVARFCGSCGAPTGNVATQSTVVQPPAPSQISQSGPEASEARSQTWFVYVLAAVAQIVSFIALAVNGGFLGDWSSMSSLGANTVLVAAPVLALAIVSVRRGPVDAKFLSAGIASALVVSVRGGVWLIDALQYSDYRWSIGVFADLMNVLAILVVVFGLRELESRRLISRDFANFSVGEQWRTLVAVAAVILLIAEKPGWVLPDRFPAVSLLVLVGMVVLAAGAPPVRQGAFAGLGVTILVCSGFITDTNLYSTAFESAAPSTSTQLIVAGGLCVLGYVEIGELKSRNSLGR